MIRFAAGVALALLALAPRVDAAEPFEMIAVDDVQALLGKPGVHVFDVNSAERFQQSHLPGAVNVNDRNVAERLPANKEATLIFYCANPK